MERGIQRAFAGVLLAFIATAGYAAEGPDNLWEVTVKMEMPGMPMAMPATKSQVCLQKDKQEKAVPMDKNCQMLDMQRSGNKMSYSFKCSGEMDMTGKGQVTFSADHNSYQGSMEAKGKSHGESMEFSQAYSGKRIGNCSADDGAKKIAAIQAQTKQTTEQACTPKAEYLTGWRMYEPGQLCTPYRDAFCKYARDLAGEMSTDTAKFTKYKDLIGDSQAREGMQRCRGDMDAIHPAICKQANAKRNWKFVADNCEAQAKAIAAKECAGRDYTAVMGSEYRPICVAYAKADLIGGSAGSAENRQQPANPANPLDSLKGGLKGLFSR